MTKLLQQITKGLIVIPSYSYTFTDLDSKEIFDPLKTESKLGHFSNWFLANLSTYRSSDPMVSCAFSNLVRGLNVRDLPKTSYGSGCLFEKLLEVTNPVEVVNFGLGTRWMPFIHYLDYIVSSPYRYRKYFYGKIELNGTQQDLLWEYHVAIRHESGKGSGFRAGLEASRLGLWRSYTLGRARINSIDYKEYFNFTKKLTRLDPWILAKGPPLPEFEIKNIIKKDLHLEYYEKLDSLRKI
jgi:aminoglycoside N3'-acetyltransferase